MTSPNIRTKMDLKEISGILYTQIIYQTRDSHQNSVPVTFFKKRLFSHNSKSAEISFHINYFPGFGIATNFAHTTTTPIPYINILWR